MAEHPVDKGKAKPPYDRDDLELLDNYNVDSPVEGDRKVWRKWSS